MLLSRPTWERLRYGHNMPRELAQSAVAETARLSIENVTRHHPRPANYKAPSRTEQDLRERYESASKDL